MNRKTASLAPLATATASTAALFALQQQADAAIIYSGPNQNVLAGFPNGGSGGFQHSIVFGGGAQQIGIYRGFGPT